MKELYLIDSYKHVIIPLETRSIELFKRDCEIMRNIEDSPDKKFDLKSIITNLLAIAYYNKYFDLSTLKIVDNIKNYIKRGYIML